MRAVNKSCCVLVASLLCVAIPGPVLAACGETGVWLQILGSGGCPFQILVRIAFIAVTGES